MAEENYCYRLLSQGEGRFKDRGSRFLAFAYPVSDLEAIETALQAVRKTYHDARHHCYAWRLGDAGETVFAQDDGEPSHSAGDPILGAIRSEQLTWTLVVVVRYFGGTKLGVRGLIEAYRTAAAEALADCEREAIIPQVTFRLDYAYEETSLVNRLLHPFSFDVVEATYTDRCSQTLAMKEVDFPQLQTQLEATALSWKVIDPA
ncbi:MAG: YigZ family protein [Bacteroidetes bacterium]|nr:MAG: YigZ family protein [Bacteroidota bacterium]